MARPGVAAAAAPNPETVRECLDLAGDAGVTACRQALTVALPAARAAALRRVLAVKLAGLRRWEDADAQLRLGHALLHLAGRPAEAVAPLQEAIRLRPDDTAAHVELGTAFAALGRASEAVAAFEEGARLDPGCLESRPAAQATFDAARRGQRWP